jgi:O-antigen/teichoic acid export membrane protein
MGVHKNLAIISLVEAVLNVFVSLILLPHWGLMGVALGTLISHVLTNGWYCFYLFNKSTKFQTESVFI